MARSASAVAALVVLAACSPSTPEAVLSKAKAHLESGEARSAIIELKNVLRLGQDGPEVRFLLGKAMFDTGDVPNAIIELKKARELGRSADEVLPLLASAMLARGDTDRVIAEFADEDLQDAKAMAELKGQVALAYGLKGRRAQARAAAELALSRDPQNVVASMALARVEMEEGKPELALKRMDALLVAKPDAVPALLMRAGLLPANRRARPEIIAAYSEVLKREAGNLTALGSLVGLHLAADEIEPAKELVARMSRRAARHPATQFYSALVSVYAKDLPRAKEQADALLASAPDNARYLHLSGAVAYQMGANAQAATHLGKAMSRTDAVVPVRTLLARTYLRLGEPHRALHALRPLFEMNPVPAEAYAIAGEAELQSGGVKAARDYLERAAKALPGDHLVGTALAFSEVQSAGLETGIATLQRIAEIDRETTADLALVSVLTERRDWPKAIEALDRLERKQPDNVLLPVMRGRIETARADFAKARHHLERAQAKDPYFVPAIHALAELDVREGKASDAKGRYQALLAKRPDVLEAELALFQLRASAGERPAEMALAAEQLVKRFPNDPEPRLALIRAHMDAGQYKEAMAVAQTGSGSFPDLHVFEEFLARAQQLSGDVNQAMKTATKLVATQPRSPVPYLRLAELHLANKDAPGAIAQLRRALVQRDDYLPAQSLLVGLLVGTNQLAEARQMAANVQRQRPTEPAGFELAGDVETAQRKPAAAAESYRAGLQRLSHGGLAVKLHRALIAAGQTGQATQFEGQWLKAQPNDPTLRFALAGNALQRGEYAQALPLLERVVELQPRNPSALNNLAWAQKEMGRAEALDTIRKALKLSPKQAALHDTLASILAARGQTEQAVEAQRQALEMEPAQHERRLRLAEYLIAAGQKSEAAVELDRLQVLGDAFRSQERVRALRQKL